MAVGFNRQVRTRPLFWDSTWPPASSTRMCFIRLGNAMANGRASSPTDASPSPSRARIALLVGSARAPNTWSRCDDKLSIRLTIGVRRGVVNNSYPYGLLRVAIEASYDKKTSSDNGRAIGWRASVKASTYDPDRRFAARHNSHLASRS